jgi:O-antigen/teichoic acid export membrane protein
MNEYKLFAQRVGLVGIANVIVSLRGVILLPILTKTLGTELYGVWAQILVTISLLMPFGLLGLCVIVPS